MLFPIVNFYIFFKILTKRFEVKNHYEDLHLVFLVFFLVLFLNFFILPDANIFMILLSIVSSLSTSGITTLNTNFDLSIFFILLSIIGGSLLSSSSGLKYVRFYILLKISHSEIYRLVKPINVYNKNLFNSESKISFDDAKIVFLVFITFIISIFILSSILTFENLSFENSFMKILKIAVSAGIFALVIVGAIYFMTLSHSKQNWVISGGEEAGKYDEVAQALGYAMADEFDPKVQVKISSGSKQNLERLQNGEADLCLVQNDLVGEKGIRSIATFYKEVLHIIVRKETASAEQLSNGTFSLGPAGGGTESLALATLRQVGFPEDEITLRKESLEKGLQALREGQADAVCIVTGIGNASVGEFLAGGEFALLDLGGDIFESIRYSYPFAHPSSIPAGAYPVKPGQGLPSDSITTIGTTVLLACRQDLADEHPRLFAQSHMLKAWDDDGSRSCDLPAYRIRHLRTAAAVVLARHD